jgi:hypothetical protein
MSLHIRALASLAIAACGDPSPPPGPAAAPAAAPASAKPVAPAVATAPVAAASPEPLDVVGTSADGSSPACGRVHPFEEMHWGGGHKPEWRAEHLVGCHFLEQPREPPSCWRVDPSTARYETVASTAGPNSANGWVHEVPSETQLLSYALVHANREGPPTGETTGVHRHGDVTVRIPPRGPLKLCKARRCKTYPGNEALVSNDWSLLIAYAYDDASTTYVAIDVAAGKQLARITTGPTRTGPPELLGRILLVHDNPDTGADDAYTAYDARSGAKLCSLGKPGFDVKAHWQLTPSRWLLQLSPYKPAPQTTGYEDELMFQDPTTCKVLAALPSPIREEPNVPIGVPGKIKPRFHPWLVPAGAAGFVLAYPGGSLAVIDPAAMKVVKRIRPPACRAPQQN